MYYRTSTLLAVVVCKNRANSGHVLFHVVAMVWRDDGDAIGVMVADGVGVVPNDRYSTTGAERPGAGGWCWYVSCRPLQLRPLVPVHFPADKSLQFPADCR